VNEEDILLVSVVPKELENGFCIGGLEKAVESILPNGPSREFCAPKMKAFEFPTGVVLIICSGLLG